MENYTTLGGPDMTKLRKTGELSAEWVAALTTVMLRNPVVAFASALATRSTTSASTMSDATWFHAVIGVTVASKLPAPGPAAAAARLSRNRRRCSAM